VSTIPWDIRLICEFREDRSLACVAPPAPAGFG
jgi:hypothetical protein